MTNDDILKFLQESNAIEGVYDADSLFQAFIAWEYIMKQEELSIGTILKVHKILMLHQAMSPIHRGYLRNCDVRVGSRACPLHSKVRELMKKWIESYTTPGIDAKIVHIEFEKIHPFVDGNGRVGRIIMNWQRVKDGLPLLIIHEGEEQQEYYKWFK